MVGCPKYFYNIKNISVSGHYVSIFTYCSISKTKHSFRTKSTSNLRPLIFLPKRNCLLRIMDRIINRIIKKNII